ncbi:MAG: class I SAM-dependent methyltransferase [Candidatus Binatia bacterium]
MKIVTGKAQDQYWKRVGYRESNHAVARAFALPKLDYIAHLINFSDARVLDVGCGNGVFTSLFSEISPFVVGLDYSEHMLRSNSVRVLLRGKGEGLPLKDGSFDVVFVSNLLHHSANPRIIVGEMARVSRRYIVLLEPNWLNPLMFLFSVVVREERGGLRSSKVFLTRLLRENGCRVIRCSAMGMISQNNTPQFLLPLLKRFDREIFWGEYLVAVAEKA